MVESLIRFFKTESVGITFFWWTDEFFSVVVVGASVRCAAVLHLTSPNNLILLPPFCLGRDNDTRPSWAPAHQAHPTPKSWKRSDPKVKPKKERERGREREFYLYCPFLAELMWFTKLSLSHSHPPHSLSLSPSLWNTPHFSSHLCCEQEVYL